MTKTQQAVQDLVNKHSKLHGDFERFGQIGAWERCEELFDAIMELAPIKLAELADDPEHPERRLAVVDAEDTTDINVWNESMTVLSPQTFYRVVKMEEK